MLGLLCGGEEEITVNVGKVGKDVRGEAFTVLMVWALPGILVCLRSHHGPPPSFLPSPSQTSHIISTYLWAPPLLLDLVCLVVLCSPASLKDLLFQLDQEHLEVLEVLGKRTNPICDTKSS